MLTTEQCIKELRDKAEYYKAVKFVSILDCELAVVKSDEAVPETLQQALRQAVRVLEDVPDHQKDWHPGSDDRCSIWCINLYSH